MEGKGGKWSVKWENNKVLEEGEVRRSGQTGMLTFS